MARHGGKRLGAGRPKANEEDMLLKAGMRTKMDDLYIKYGSRALDVMFAATLGYIMIYRRDKIRNEKGRIVWRKHVLVTDPDEVVRALDELDNHTTKDGSYYRVAIQKPNWRVGERILRLR